MSTDLPLTVSIEDGELVIRIGFETLAFAVQHDPQLIIYDAAMGEFFAPEVTDEAVWAKEVCRALEREEEDGTTLVHLMLDKAVMQAFESGAEGIKLAEDLRDATRSRRDFPPENDIPLEPSP